MGSRETQEMQTRLERNRIIENFSNLQDLRIRSEIPFLLNRKTTFSNSNKETVQNAKLDRIKIVAGFFLDKNDIPDISND